MIHHVSDMSPGALPAHPAIHVLVVELGKSPVSLRYVVSNLLSGLSLVVMSACSLALGKALAPLSASATTPPQKMDPCLLAPTNHRAHPEVGV